MVCYPNRHHSLALNLSECCHITVYGPKSSFIAAVQRLHFSNIESTFYTFIFIHTFYTLFIQDISHFVTLVGYFNLLSITICCFMFIRKVTKAICFI